MARDRASAVNFNETVDAVYYGSHDNDSEINDDNDDTFETQHERIPLTRDSIASNATYSEDEVESMLSSLEEEDLDSFHLGDNRVSVTNVFTSIRRTPSFEEYGGEYKLVPTKRKDNIKLITDPNLLDHEGGRLYYARYSFYNNHREPKYALTVQPGIYREMILEINEAYSVPCGLYFCCHGGDAAHTGVSVEDYVDIRLAWILVTIIFITILSIQFIFPWPEHADDIAHDDLYRFVGGHE